MPDLNSVPASPHTLDASRQAPSQAMPPPPVPRSPLPNILPSNQTVVASGTTSSSALASPQLPPPVTASHTQESVGVGPGPWPIRHPRPLTAAELHLELEKEQEAVVNRLTRELSLLRAAQNASVVSNASSTSASVSVSGAEGTPATDLISGSGFSIPSTSGRRHHRTSSSHSARSQAIMGTSFGASSMVSAGPLPAAAGRPSATSLSRQDSTASRRSRASSPAPHLHHSNPIDITHGGSYFQRGPPLSGSHSHEISPGLMQATHRYEELAYYRSELESAKRENEALRRRLQDLEKAIREGRFSDSNRTRSDSVSTTASVQASATATTGAGVAGSSGVAIAGRREGGGRDRVVSVTGSVGVGIPEDEVRVGESAASAGLGSAQTAPKEATT